MATIDYSILGARVNCNVGEGEIVNILHRAVKGKQDLFMALDSK